MEQEIKSQTLKKINLDDYHYCTHYRYISPVITLKKVNLNDLQQPVLKEVKINKNENKTNFYYVPQKQNIFKRFINKMIKVF